MMRMWPGRRMLIVGCFFFGLAAGAGGVWLVTRPRPGPVYRTPPRVVTEGIDPHIARTIRAATIRVQRTPREADAWGLLGGVLFVHGFPAQAVDCFREAEAIDSHDPRWPYLLGFALTRTAPEEAMAALRRAVSRTKDPTGVMRLRLADLLLHQGHTSEAEAQFTTLLATPSAPQAELGLARCDLARADLASCLARLDRCVKDSRTRQAAHRLRSEIYQRQGKPQLAQAERQRAAGPSAPGLADPFVDEMEALGVGLEHNVRRAVRMIEAGMAEQAVGLLLDLLQDYPDSAAGWHTLAMAHRHVRDHHAAETALRRAIEKGPDAPEIHHDLGRLLCQRNRPAEATEHLAQAVRLRPDDISYRLALVETLLNTKQPTEARPHLEAILHIDPDHSTAKALLAKISDPDAK